MMSTRAALRPSIPVTILSAVAACGAYLWVLTIGVTSMQGRYDSRWNSYPVGPAVVVFIATMLVLLAAMAQLWRRGQKPTWSNLLWVAGLLTWSALASNFVVWAVEATDSLAGWTGLFLQLSGLTIGLAVFAAVAGLGLRCTEIIRHRRSSRPSSRGGAAS